MRHRTGLLRYVKIAVLVILAIPASAILSVFLVGIWTPGAYVAMKLVPAPNAPWSPSAFDPLIPRLVVAGLVNLACCYAVIRALIASVALFRRGNAAVGPKERS
jgi:hypothetical protein